MLRRAFGVEIDPPLAWAAAEESCHLMGADTHLASVTTEEQQRAVAHLAKGTGRSQTWIGLNDVADEGSFVWSDDEPLEYSNFVSGDPNGDGDGVTLWQARDYKWNDSAETTAFPYICTRKALPTSANGGDMLGCVGGHWLMGVPYTASVTKIPPTTAFGIYDPSVYEVIKPITMAINETVATPADVRLLSLPFVLCVAL